MSCFSSSHGAKASKDWVDFPLQQLSTDNTVCIWLSLLFSIAFPMLSVYRPHTSRRPLQVLLSPAWCWDLPFPSQPSLAGSYLSLPWTADTSPFNSTRLCCILPFCFPGLIFFQPSQVYHCHGSCFTHL